VSYVLCALALYAAGVFSHNDLQFNAVLAGTTLSARVCKGKLNFTYDDIDCSVLSCIDDDVLLLGGGLLPN